MSRIAELVVRRLADEADSMERAELASLLAADPALQDAYLVELRLHVALVDHYRGPAASTVIERLHAVRSGLGSSSRRRLHAGMRRAHRQTTIRRWWPLAAAALVVITAGVLWLVQPGSVPAPVLEGTALAANGAIELPEGGLASLHWADGSQADLFGPLAARLDGQRLRIGHGEARLSVAHQTGGQVFVLAAGDADISVLGTRFSVSVAGSSTWVQVDEGRVAVVADGRRVEAAAGDVAVRDAAGIRLLPVSPPDAWRDHRSVGLLMLPVRSNDPGPAGNPRGWGDLPSVQGADGRKALIEWVQPYVDTCVTTLGRLDGQGLIFFNLEGQQDVGTAGYHASPQRLAELAPEMDDLVDPMLARVRAAGLAVGMPISHRPGLRPLAAAQELSRIIAHCRQRWQADLFLLWNPLPADGDAGKAELLRLLARSEPGVRLAVSGVEAPTGVGIRTFRSAYEATDPALSPGLLMLNARGADPLDESGIRARLGAGDIPAVDVWWPSLGVGFLERQQR